jgi:hypothetical protein
MGTTAWSLWSPQRKQFPRDEPISKEILSAAELITTTTNTFSPWMEMLSVCLSGGAIPPINHCVDESVQLTVHIVKRSSKIIYRKMYPCVGHTAGPAKIKVNFGESDFVWSGAKSLALDDVDFEMLRPRRRMTGFSRDRSRERRGSTKDMR